MFNELFNKNTFTSSLIESKDPYMPKLGSHLVTVIHCCHSITDDVIASFVDYADLRESKIVVFTKGKRRFINCRPGDKDYDLGISLHGVNINWQRKFKQVLELKTEQGFGMKLNDNRPHHNVFKATSMPVPHLDARKINIVDKQGHGAETTIERIQEKHIPVVIKKDDEINILDLVKESCLKRGWQANNITEDTYIELGFPVSCIQDEQLKIVDLSSPIVGWRQIVTGTVCRNELVGYDLNLTILSKHGEFFYRPQKDANWKELELMVKVY